MSLLQGCCIQNYWKHRVTILVYQPLSKSAMYEHRYLENIKKLYKSAWKYDDQQQWKAILETAMISTTEWFTYNSPMSLSQYATAKNTSARKSFCQFLYTLEVKHETAVHRFCSTKSKRKSTRAGNTLFTVYQRGRDTKESINRSKNIFTIGFYNILRFFSIQ